MAVNLDAINQLSKQYIQEYWDRFMADLAARTAVKHGVSCVKCRRPFFDLGPLGIHCDCDYHRPIQEPFTYA